MAREILQVRYVNADNTSVYVSLVNTSDLDKISKFIKIDIEGIQGNNYTFTPPFQTSGRNIVLNNTAGVPTGYFSGMTVYADTGVSDKIEWRSKSTYEYRDFRTEYEYDNDIYPSASHTKQTGRKSQIYITWEEKYVNDLSTGETRNYSESTIDYGQPQIEVIGTKTDTIEWRNQSETVVNKFKTKYEYNNDLLPKNSYTRISGINEEILITWEEKYVNGVSTGEKRNRNEKMQTVGRDEIKVIGTKSETIEWRKMSNVVVTEFKKTTENDNSKTPEQSYIKQNGINREVLETWEEKYVDGVSTNEKRNFSEVVKIEGQKEIKVIGTKTDIPVNPLPNNDINFPTLKNVVKAIEYKNDSSIYFGTLDYITYSNDDYTFTVNIYNDSDTDVVITQINDGNETHDINPIVLSSKKWTIKFITFIPKEQNSKGITLIASSTFERILVKEFQLAKGSNIDTLEINNYDNEQALKNITINSTQTNADLKILKDALVATATKDEVIQTLNDQLQPIKSDVVQNKSNLSVLSEQVSSKVSKSDYTVDQNNIVSRLNNADSARVQLANQISDKVTTTQLSTSMQSAKDYIDKNQKSNELRMNTMETSISQNGQAIQLKTSQQEFNATRKTLSQVISEITATTSGINLSYDNNGAIQSVSVANDGVKLRGDKVDITVNDEFRVMANRVSNVQSDVSNKVGKDDIINRINLSPEGLDIDVSKIGIRGGDNIDYIDIRGNSILSYGQFTRTWANVTDTANLRLGIQGGTVKIQNRTTGYNLYLTEKGLSTMLAGAGDETAGTLEFHSTKYNDTSRGVRLHSTYGAVALESDYSRIILNANLTVNIESNYGIYFRPFRDSRAGNNEFAMYVKQNDSGAYTDGVIKYGNISSETSQYGSGLRFSKSSVDSVVYATIKDGDIGTGDFYGNKLYGALTAKETNAYVLVDDELRITDKKGYNNGNVNYKDLRTNSINTTHSYAFANHSGSDVYFGVGYHELRITANNFWNGGNPAYQNIRFGKWYAMSSEKFKYDIKEWNYSVLDAYRNDLKLYSYKYKSEKDSKYIRNHHGVIIERELPIEWRHGDGFDGNEVMFWNAKAIQELVDKYDNLNSEYKDLKKEVEELKALIKKNKK